MQQLAHVPQLARFWLLMASQSSSAEPVEPVAVSIVSAYGALGAAFSIVPSSRCCAKLGPAD